MQGKSGKYTCGVDLTGIGDWNRKRIGNGDGWKGRW